VQVPRGRCVPALQPSTSSRQLEVADPRRRSRGPRRRCGPTLAVPGRM